jgi:hypothetical protein
VTLTTNGKNYIAAKFGISRCYVSSGLSYSYLGTDDVTYFETGGTSQLVSRLVMSSIVQSITYLGTVYTYEMLRANNSNTDVTLTDVQWITQHDGFSDIEPQYCVTPICAWIATKGGVPGIAIPGIFELVDAYTGFANIGFIPTITEIIGVVDYYLEFTTSGNTKTGCNY